MTTEEMIGTRLAALDMADKFYSNKDSNEYTPDDVLKLAGEYLDFVSNGTKNSDENESQA